MFPTTQDNAVAYMMLVIDIVLLKSNVLPPDALASFFQLLLPATYNLSQWQIQDENVG